MNKTEKELDKSKRGFIKKSTLAGAGVVATMMVSGEAVAEIGVDDETTPENKGYHLTQHVLDYYKSAAS